LIKIIKLFNKKYHYIKDIEFIIIGSGTYSKYLNKKITNFLNVKYYGFIKDEEKFELLASSNLAIATSNIEPFSLVVLEYLFSGLKVLSTPVSGPKEIISKNEIFGKILDFNPNTFVNEIFNEYNQWKNNKDDFFKIKLKRSELAKEYFNIEKTFLGYKNMIDKILKIYDA
jgi:glycosyltransferase involved in cell wall biosynthesis